jgi:hypothetical protein
VINGQCAGDFSGWSVSSAGDVNGDGLADLIVGAKSERSAAGSDAGRSYVVFGQTGGSAVDLSAIAAGSGGFVINGQCAGDRSGSASRPPATSMATAGRPDRRGYGAIRRRAAMPGAATSSSARPVALPSTSRRSPPAAAAS